MKISSILDLYSVKILLYLYQGETRFSELLDNVVPVRSTLSYTLIELSDDKLIERIVVESKPIQVKYTLTDKGREVAEYFLQLKSIFIES